MGHLQFIWTHSQRDCFCNQKRHLAVAGVTACKGPTRRYPRRLCLVTSCVCDCRRWNQWYTKAHIHDMLSLNGSVCLIAHPWYMSPTRYSVSVSPGYLSEHETTRQSEFIVMQPAFGHQNKFRLPNREATARELICAIIRITPLGGRVDKRCKRPLFTCCIYMFVVWRCDEDI